MSASSVMSLVEHRVTMPREHEIIGLRELSEEEAKRIETATDLITSVATSRRFRRVQSLSQMAASRVSLVEARDQPTRQEVESCRALIDGLVHAQREFISDATELIADREVSEAIADAESALTHLAASPEWKTLGGLAEPGTGLAFDREHDLGILDREERFTAVAPLVDRAFRECEDGVSPVSWTRSG